MSLEAKGILTKAQNNVNRANSNGDSIPKYMQEEVIDLAEKVKDNKLDAKEVARVYGKRDEENRKITDQRQEDNSPNRLADFMEM